MNGKADLGQLLLLASVYEKGRFFTEEAKVLDEAEKIAATPKEKESVYFMRGAMFERQKKVEPAEAEFRKVLASNPGALRRAELSGLHAGGSQNAGRRSHADDQEGAGGDPENGAYLDSLGWAYYQQGKFEEAEGLLTRAMERIGQDPTVHDHLGDVYFKLGKIKEAITQWQASLKDFRSPAGVDSEPEDVAKVTRKLDAARVKLGQGIEVAGKDGRLRPAASTGRRSSRRFRGFLPFLANRASNVIK